VTRVLVITGSRAVLDTNAAREHTRCRIHTAIDVIKPRALVHGGAPGVDAIADAVARERGGIVRARFDLDGWRYRDDARAARWTDEARAAIGPKRWPLHRNDCMVGYCLARPDLEPFLYGIFAPWSRTHGCLYTARLTACDARVLTWVDEVPMEYAS